MRARNWQVLANIVTLVIMLVLNALANTLPLNGRTTGEISDRYNALFTPAGYVFSIWGLIYLGLIGFTVFQALPAQRTNPRVAATGWWVALSNVANSLWIVFWHYELLALTMLIMLSLLTALIVIYGRVNAPGLAPPDWATRWLVQAPFSLYLGWISVATFANLSVFLISLGLEELGRGVGWTVLLILVAGGLALRLRDPIYSLVIIWAVVGILVRQAAVWPIVLAAGAAAVVSLAGLLLALARKPVVGTRAGAG